MIFCDAIKAFRNELGITQMELATILHVNEITVRRWELGKNLPNRSVVSILIDYAIKSGASNECIERLRQSTIGAAKNRLEKKNGVLSATEHSSLVQLIDDASYPIYVCSLETDELLYVNHQTERMLNSVSEQLVGKKCYECLMRRNSPCPNCHKNELSADCFTAFRSFDPINNTYHLIQGKLIKWKGKKAHARYIIDAGSAMEATAQSTYEAAYAEQLHLRRELAEGSVAVAHFNLTHNTVSDIAGSCERYMKYLSEHSLDEVLRCVAEQVFSVEDQKVLESISDRKSLIQQFYMGRTHITYRHYINGMDGVYESVLDLIQNPVTFDIEAFGQVHNVTQAAMATAVAKCLFNVDYETITTIDAKTGAAHPYIGNRIHDVISEQIAVGDNVEGVAAYLRKYCADEDVDSVINGTSLSYVKEQLEACSYYHITYSLRINGKIIYKRVLYTYLDCRRTMILCAMQDITDLHIMRNAKHDQLSDALQILQEQSGMNVARYDLKTKTFYSNCDMTANLGYGAVIENVPDTFINDGRVAPECVEDFRAFYENLRNGEVSILHTKLEMEGGAFHRICANARIIRDDSDVPYRAIIVFQDVDELQEKSSIYKRWKQLLQQKAPESYTLLRCNLTNGSFYDKAEGKLLPLNYKFEQITFNQRVMDYAGRFVHIDDFEAYTKLMNSENLLASYYRGTYTTELTYRERTGDDEYRWLHLSVEMARYPDSADIEAFLMYEPTDMEYHNDGQTNSLGNTAFENTGLVIAKYNRKHQTYLYDTDMSKHLFGRYDSRPLWEIFLTDGVADTQDVRVMQNVVHELNESATRTSGSAEVELKTPSKAKHRFFFSALKQNGADESDINTIITFLDINDDVLKNKKLRFRAEHDSLTGLYNRTAFLKLVTETVSNKPADSFILLCSDINDFGIFNDRYGREEGDRLLQFSAKRLNDYAEEKNAFAGRLSNDVFAILLPNTSGVLERTERIIRSYFDGYPLKAKISGRAGVYIISDPTLNADSMLDMAATAKESIKGKYDKWLAVFDESMNEQRIHEKYITDRMENALADGQFDIYIQPQFHHGTGQIVGAEALVRWIDPECGVVLPADFIPVFEKTGFIAKMDEYVWEKTAERISTWIANGNAPVPISVNVSREDTNDPQLCSKLVAITEKYSVPTSYFRLEITESLFAESPKRLAAVVNELHKAGFLVEMDDFGSGYSSLNILKDVPVDILKLDMCFFSGNDNLGRGGMILNSVLRMSRWLEIPVIAEGVELKEQADFLLSIGCPTIQGYLYEKPLSVDEFERLLHMRGKRQPVPLNLIETRFDLNSFWNPTSADSQIFNNCIGPASVFEYHDGEYEIVRMNRQFMEAMGISDPETKLSAREIASISDRDIAKFRKAVLEVIYSCKDTAIDIVRTSSDGIEQPFRVTMRVVAKSADRALIFATLNV